MWGKGTPYSSASPAGWPIASTPVEGTIAKTALAGWFRSEPDYQQLMRQQLGSATQSRPRPAVTT